MQKEKGFTLIEVLASLLILVVAITSTFQVINHLLYLKETNDITVPSLNAAQGMLDEIRNVPFDSIISEYSGQTFTVEELTNKGISHRGVVLVNSLEDDFLLRVKVVICWMQKNRIMGEDKNLNGILDSGEDKDGNGEIDSPCSLETSIVSR